MTLITNIIAFANNVVYRTCALLYNYLLYNPIFVLLETLVVIDVCADFMFHEHVCMPKLG